MQRLIPCVIALLSLALATPSLATECVNSGAAPGVAPNDTDDAAATACGQGAVADGSSSMALGAGASSVGIASTALGYAASSGGANSTALGQATDASGHFSMAVGFSASSAGALSIALGSDASSAGELSTALGRQANSAGASSTALGSHAYSAGASSTALGYNASSLGPQSHALGLFASSGGFGSIALGGGTSSAGGYSAALGVGAVSSADRSTALGVLAFANQPDTVILGSIAGVNNAAFYARIGIGTSTPAEAVDVERSAAAARFQLTSFTATANEAPQYIQRRARGTRLAPTAVQNGDNLGLFSFRGYNGATMGGSRATITAQAAGTFTGASNPTRLIFSTTPVGQTTPQSVLVITPDGKVQVKGVNLNVPDYVFEDDYELMPLAELKSFIDENGHLPGMASAQQVKDEGLDLAGSQMNLLQKVEELTLYALQQQAHLQAQQERIAELEAQQEQIQELKALVGQLSSQIAQN